LQAFGEQLVTLPSAHLERLGLPDALCQAIFAAQGMHQRGARKRQMQYIGKLLRQLEPALLRTALEALEAEYAVAPWHQQALERLYRALREGEEAH
jgi:ribosome-associated protein